MLLVLIATSFAALAAPAANAQAPRLVAQASPSPPSSNGIQMAQFNCLAADARAVSAEVRCWTNRGFDWTSTTLPFQTYVGPAASITGGYPHMGSFTFCASGKFTYANGSTQWVGTVDPATGEPDLSKCTADDAGFATIIGL
jgi:hypothetical protein